VTTLPVSPVISAEELRRPERVEAEQSPSGESERVSFKTWLAVVGVNIGAFLAVLNIQIVNSALLDIQGAIGAGIDDGGWVATSYLVTEIIVIPLTGWLSRAFSMRIYLITNTALFLLFSAGCATSHSLGEMIAWRAFQGATGGVLIPLAFTVIMTMLPKAKQPIGLTMFALGATFAPAIGPTIGGWLNETYGWQYIFYVNLVPGVFMLALLFFSLEPSPMNLPLLRRGDWAGIVTMALALGSLQTVLEEGNKDDWFGSPFIVRLSAIAAVSFALFLFIEFRTREPVLELRLLGRRNFGLATLANGLMGGALYGSTYILPLYLAQIQGYNAEQIGEVVAWVGLPQLVLIPLVPLLLRWFDSRLLVGFGLALFAVSNLMDTHLSLNSSGPQLLWPNIVRAVGQAVILAPLAGIATAGIERRFAPTASALFNMTRNLGGAIGIAALETLLTKREQFHSNILSSAVSDLDEATRFRIAQLTHYFTSHGSDAAYARHEAVVAIGNSIRQQAFIMAYSDMFAVMGLALIGSIIALMFVKRATAGSGTGSGGH
jgi:MFS transporter, DHA2 family, multidrug resistance protein